MWDLFCSLTAACSIIWAAFGFGRPLWRLLHELGEAGDRDAAETALWSLTLGMLVGGLALTVLAETGVLHVLSVALLTLAGVVSAMLELACIAAGTKFRGLVRRGFDGLKRRILHAGWWSLPVGLAGVLLLVPLAGALSPPVDAELLQHYLEPPKQVLLAGGLGREAAPGALDLAQFWSLWALALEGPVAANLVHLCLAVLFVVATMTLARHWHEPPGDKLAALFAMTCPVALAQFGVASSGIAGALTATLSIIAALRAAALGERSWFMLSAVMLGATLAIDPVCAALCLVAAGAILISACNRVSVKLGGKSLGIAALVSAPWLGAVRIPELSNFAWPSVDWPVVACGPWVGFGLGALLFERLNVGRLLAAGGILAALWVLPGPTAMLAVFPLLAVLAARGAVRVVQLRGAALASIVAIASLAIVWELCSQLPELGPRIAVASGWQSREEYLVGHQGTYRAAAVFNHIRRDGQRLLAVDAEGFYFSAPVADARNLSRGDELRSEDDWIAMARRRGFDYLLLAHSEKSGGATEVAAAAGNARTSEKLPHSAEVIPILEYRFADDNNRCIRYRLWKLQGSHTGSAQPTVVGGGSDELSARPRTPAR